MNTNLHCSAPEYSRAYLGEGEGHSTALELDKEHLEAASQLKVIGPMWGPEMYWGDWNWRDKKKFSFLTKSFYPLSQPLTPGPATLFCLLYWRDEEWLCIKHLLQPTFGFRFFHVQGPTNLPTVRETWMTLRSKVVRGGLTDVSCPSAGKSHPRDCGIRKVISIRRT